MKNKIIILFTLLLSFNILYAQEDGGVFITDKENTNVEKIDPSAILQIEGTGKGILLPRTEIDWYKDDSTMPNAPEGLFFFDKKTERLVYRSNDRWYGAYKESDAEYRNRKGNVKTLKSHLTIPSNKFGGIQDLTRDRSKRGWEQLFMDSRVNIADNLSDIHIHAQGVASIKAKTIPSPFAFAVGIFVDGRLHTVRKFYKEAGDNLCNIKKYDISAVVKNLSKGTHNIELYVRNIGTPPNNEYDKIVYGAVSACSDTNTPDLKNYTYLSTEILEGRNSDELPPFEYDPRDWMKYLDEDTKLKDITIIGTHDAGTRSGGIYSKTQDGSLTQQLNAGVRYFDIRLKRYDGYEDLFVYHGPVYMNLEFKRNVLSTFIDFLQHHPTETIFMVIKNENNGDSQPEKWKKRVAEILSEYEGTILRYFDDNTTIKEAKGKIAVINRNGPIDNLVNIGGIGDNKSAEAYFYRGDRSFITDVFFQDVYKVKGGFFGSGISYEEKMRYITDIIEKAQRNSDAWYINNTNGTSLPFYTPRTVAENINLRIYDYLRKHIMNPVGYDNKPNGFIPKRLGFFVIDFATTGIGPKIIDLAIRQSIFANNVYYSELYGLKPMYIPN